MKTEEELIWESYIESFQEGTPEEFPLVFEGLIASVSLITAQSLLYRNLSMVKELQKIDIENRGVVILKFENPISEKTALFILKLINNIGYFPAGILRGGGYSKYEFKNLVDNKYGFWLCIEPKYDQMITITKDLYHVTPNSKLEKIKRIGLTPKSMSKLSNHPDRIYLAVNELGADFIREQLAQYNEDLVTLKIDIEKVQYHKFMKDPNYALGVYTYQNIQPDAIEVVEIKNN